jgi:hypothetical protein
VTYIKSGRHKIYMATRMNLFGIESPVAYLETWFLGCQSIVFGVDAEHSSAKP